MLSYFPCRICLWASKCALPRFIDIGCCNSKTYGGRLGRQVMWIRADFITNHKMKTLSSLLAAKSGHLVIMWRAYQRIGGFSKFFIGNHWIDARLAVHDGIGLQCLQCVKVFRCRQPRNGQTIVAGCRVWAQFLRDLLAIVNLSMCWFLHSLLHLVHFFLTDDLRILGLPASILPDIVSVILPDIFYITHIWQFIWFDLSVGIIIPNIWKNVPNHQPILLNGPQKMFSWGVYYSGPGS